MPIDDPDVKNWISNYLKQQEVHFGGTSGSENDEYLEILTIKQKEMPKNDPDVKNWISNYHKQ